MLTERGKQVRRSALKLMRENGLTHIGGSFSCAEILIALYDHVMTKDDVFILSKGHGCGVYYVMLRERGYSPKIEVHPHKDLKDGIPFTSGSLGHGLPFAVGIALAKKINKEDGRVFVLCGDGEVEEGSYVEAIQIIKQLSLTNIVLVVDRNGYRGSSESIDYSLWDDMDGHDINKITEALRQVSSPFYSISAKTVKGSGISFLENTIRSHSTWLTDEEYEQALKELQ